MRDYLKETLLLNLIASFYPGGQEQFEADGGHIEALPWGEAAMLIPEQGTELREKMVQLQSMGQTAIMLVNTLCIELATREDYNQETLKFLEVITPLLVQYSTDLIVKPNVLCMTIYAPGKQLNPDLYKDLEAALKGFKGLLRAVVYWDSGHQWVLQNDKPHVILEPTKRDKPIDVVDVNNLHKMLGEIKSVDDLLDKI